MGVLDGLGFRFADKYVSPAAYGDDYLTEFCRVLETYAPPTVKAVLEWGSGLTTQVLAQYVEKFWGAEFFLTIDSYKEYQDAIFLEMPKPQAVVLRCIDQIGPCKNQHDPELAYSTLPLSFGQKFDVIFIDGRRRMECAFIATILANPECLVVLHDYRRGRYQPVHALYNVIEDGSQFRVMRVRPELVSLMSDRLDKLSPLWTVRAPI